MNASPEPVLPPPAEPIRVGEVEVHVLRDGADRVPPELILRGATSDEQAAAVSRYGDSEGQLPVVYNGLLIRSAGRLILIDAGIGWMSEAEGAGGELLANLQALGIEPADVDDVLISHGHLDHTGGLTAPDAGGIHAPVFSRATHWFWRDEWRYWTSESELAAMPASFADAARISLPPLAAAGLVEVTDVEREIAEGIRFVAAPGHTPGHAAVTLESAGERALYVGDALFHVVNATSPDRTCVFDVDGAAAVRTRRSLLDRAARERSLVFAAHLADAGRVEASGTGYRFLPG